MWIYFLTSFFATFFLLMLFLKLGGFGKYVEDHNKPVTRKVLSGGGFIVVLVVSSLYILCTNSDIVLSIVGMLILAFIIGFYDDIRRIRKWKKVPILSIASLPIILIYLLDGHNLWDPTLLTINFGWFYWIVIIPIVVAGFANGGNVIAGYDGMETGIYTLISFLYLLIGIVMHSNIIIFLSGILLFSLLAMLIMNWYPSKLLLGNVGSFAISALLGIIPLIGHFEIVLPIIFLPHLIEVYLQLKYTPKFKYDVFGDVDERGIIHNRYGIKSIIHWIISWGNMNEWKVTLAMLSIESLLCITAFFSWYMYYFLMY